tara:strand:- start:15057 stop:15728 length:672 start_codon:yes stop_codon:yes gene_type:complete
MKNILVISAHPDDETLGAGGTLLKHKKNNDNLNWLIFTNINEKLGFSADQVETRKKEINKVSSAFGFQKTINLNYGTTKLDSSLLIKMIPQVSRIVSEIKPEIIYLMNRSDPHSDHRIAFQTVIPSMKSFRYPYVKKILMYECISETEFSPPIPEMIFQPNYFVDITDYIDKKIDIFQIYKSEIGIHPFPRSEKNIKSLASFRGAIAGVEYAEAFQIIKIIDK